MLSKVVGFTYRKVLKPILFKKDPENVHDNFTRVGSFLGSIGVMRAITGILFKYEDKMLLSVVDGVKYSNPIGLSAGFDKDANLHNILDKVGFGFEEVGSVTLKAYEGNPTIQENRFY